MLRTIVLTSLFLAIALGGGIWSVWFALNTNSSFGAITIGNWTAYPIAGTSDDDPYSVARRARDAELPLGQAEGLPFYARTDADGRALSGSCNYQLMGKVPSARFWTLFVADTSLMALKAKPFRNDALHSRQLLRNPDSSFSIAVGPEPEPGNWISTNHDGDVIFVLTLYDTQVASTVTSVDRDFPSIIRTGCRDA